MRGSVRHPKNIMASPATYRYIVAGCLFCWVSCCIFSVGFPFREETDTPLLWNTIYQALPNKQIAYLAGFLLALGGAFLLHRLNYTVMLIREKNYLPLVLYLLLTSTNFLFFPLNATSISAFFIIIALYFLFISYHDTFSQDKIFAMSFSVGIGSLIWIQILWFVPLFWYGMYLFKSLNLKTFSASILGLATVYWFLLGWCVWSGDYTAFTIPFNTLVQLNLLHFSELYMLDFIELTIIFALTLTAIINIITHNYLENLRTRRYLSFLITMTFWSGLLYLLYEQPSEELQQTAYISAALLLSHLFTVLHNRVMCYLFYIFTFTLFVLLAYQVWNF